ncbi:hypothetical protein GCM10009039_01230 [Halocalculus aciditolerans]|uniref:Uncharacterized protein n=1 Tax=Halocalculus aciditolerans TaxID=1383812 RepID=A0A830FH35_9EURY|nr:hypothetical protein GCM10009039_01230 [Halocalculus aciditolerans]
MFTTVIATWHVYPTHGRYPVLRQATIYAFPRTLSTSHLSHSSHLSEHSDRSRDFAALSPLREEMSTKPAAGVGVDPLTAGERSPAEPWSFDQGSPPTFGPEPAADGR